MIRMLVVPALFGFGSGLLLVVGGRILAKRLHRREGLRAR